jgi:Ca2+-binding RTX toxin-like protein
VSAETGTGNGYTLVGSAGADTITGGAGADSINGGSGIDTISAGGGDDVITGGGGNDSLTGGAGVDTMVGGSGNDTYYVDNVGDVTTELAGAGIDTVYSSVKRTLGADIENLTLTGTAAINGTGNGLNNMLTGNAGANILNGGLGNDTLAGGVGNDVFVFNTALGATNIDSVTDFIATDDTIRLSKTIFSKIINTGMLNMGRFCASTDGSAADADDYILYNTSTGALFYDADGNKVGTAVQFATLDAKPPITNTDFMVVA